MARIERLKEDNQLLRVIFQIFLVTFFGLVAYLATIPITSFALTCCAVYWGIICLSVVFGTAIKHQKNSIDIEKEELWMSILD